MHSILIKAKFDFPTTKVCFFEITAWNSLVIRGALGLCIYALQICVVAWCYFACAHPCTILWKSQCHPHINWQTSKSNYGGVISQIVAKVLTTALVPFVRNTWQPHRILVHLAWRTLAWLLYLNSGRSIPQSESRRNNWRPRVYERKSDTPTR